MTNCITDSDYVTAAEKQAEAINKDALTKAAINGALALWQRNSSKSITNMQYDAANANMKLAEDLHAHRKKFWKYEKAYVDDAFNEPYHEPEYALAVAWEPLSKNPLTTGKTAWQREMNRLCLPFNKCLNVRWERTKQNQASDAISFADRQAERRADALNDMRYAKQYSALGLGHGLLNSITSYSAVSNTSGLNAGSILESSINSGLSALGYYNRPKEKDGWGSSAKLSLHTAPFSVAGRTGGCGAEPEGVSIYSPEYTAWAKCMRERG